MPSESFDRKWPLRPAAETPQRGNENRARESSPFLYDRRGFTSSQRSEVELLDKSCGDGSSNEICPVELDRGKIDELANDYRAETCVSYDAAIQNESREDIVENAATLLRDEDKFRCRFNRKRKTRREMSKGIVIDLGKDIYDTSHRGVTINVISMRNLVPKTKLITVSKRHLQSSMQSRSLRKKTMNKMTDNSVLLVFCPDKIKKAGKSIKRKCKNHGSKLTDNESRRDIDTTINASNRLDILNERKLQDNLVQLSRMPDETILDSTKCCHDDNNAPIDIARYPALKFCPGQACIGAREYPGTHCCTIFHDKRQEYDVCDREDGYDFDAETRAGWPGYFHPECIHAGECRCLREYSSEYRLDINTRHDCCPSAAMREGTAGGVKNSALTRRHRWEGAERCESTSVTSRCPGRDRFDRCATCDEGRANSTIRKCVASRTSVRVEVEPSKSFVELCDSHAAHAPSRCEINTRPGKYGRQTTATTTTTTTMTLVSRDDERPTKSASLTSVDTWDTRRDDDPIRRRCEERYVVAESPRSEGSREKEEGFARGMDSGWKQGSIETDVRQLDYKWKRKIATADADTRASVDCEEKRDSRYKLDEAIRVQLRESAEIRKRESLQMGEATSQTRSDNTNVDCKRRETRDYSLWTSLQMGKIWLRVHDACKNVVKLAATRASRVARDVSKSERTWRNLVKVAVASLVLESSSSRADKICEETRDKNFTRPKSRGKSQVRRECEIGDANDAETSMRRDPRVVTSSRREMRERMRRNVKKGKNEKSCVFYRERERDGYRDVVEFLPPNGTHDHDENVYPQSRLSGSFTYLEDSAYLGPRNRGGSDDGRDAARSTGDKQRSVRRIYEESRSIRYRNCTSKKCACCSRTQESRGRRVEHQNSQRANVSYEPSVTPDRRTIRADVSDVSRGNPPHRELQSRVSISRDDGQGKTSERAGSREKMESHENFEGAETARHLMSEIAETSTDPTLRSSRNNPDEPTASTSEWESLLSSGKSPKYRPGSRSPFCTTTMKFRRKRYYNGKIASFKRSKRNIGRKEPPNVTTHDSGMKITQIEPSTVQAAREGNKKRIDIKIRSQTPDAIIARILSKFLVNGETKKRVLMNITIELESDHDVLDGREVGTQTSNDVIFTETDVLRYSDGCPRATIAATSKIVQCFVCDKRDCYEMKRSNDSITLEDALIAEYPETSKLNDVAERKIDNEIPP